MNKATRIRVAHINDTHSYFEPTTVQLSLNIDDQTVNPYISVGGFARICTRSQQLKQQAASDEREFVFLHAGDCFQGTLYFSLFKGEANSKLLNQLDLTAMTLGNHELDMGNGPVAAFSKRINFPLLCGNWDLSNELMNKPVTVSDSHSVYPYQPTLQSAQWLEHKVGEERIAIFGLSIDKMVDIANPDPDTPFVNAKQTAINTVQQIQQSGINKIILLSHLGYEADLKLAQSIDGISLIVGGHSHVLQGDFSDLGLPSKDRYGMRVNDTYIVQAGMHAQSLGHCDIDFDESGKITAFTGLNEILIGRRVCFDATMSDCSCDGEYKRVFDYLTHHPHVVRCQKDPQVNQVLTQTYKPAVQALQQNIVGHLKSPLRHVRVPDDKGSSEICPLVAESFYHAMCHRGFELDFAIHNAGGVRCSLNSGPISQADIAGRLLPFAVPIGVYSIEGQYIKDILEGAIDNAIAEDGTGTGSYPYSYRLDYQVILEANKGDRVKNIRIYDDIRGWTEINPQQIYWGTSSAYSMKGKEGYSAILNCRDDWSVTEMSMADCFLEFVSREELRIETQIKLGLIT
ncbi:MULTISPECIES: bifunctional metallophosphatase/5'-nucleotidase [unclassified Vibrio]|uniref:bifunctional metallophosphatase/5'-nucleotidase n=1 Tax=unclassified Vibrio TaxID=2614977 RepID=UPI0009EDCF67|nr:MULTISPECIES: bifunctional UDP-sugar hydrolase/5'-nucleotidase [unclassified Vibrio]